MVWAGILFLCFVIGGLAYLSLGHGFIELAWRNGVEVRPLLYLTLVVVAGCVCLSIWGNDKILRYVLLIGASYYVFVYLILVFFRIRYPFELEWMEGTCVDHVMRVLSGQQLYVKPSLEFIPYIYTPFYFYLSAALSKIIGTGFMPLRLVSFVSSLGCFFVIFSIVKRETQSVYWGIVSACLFAATFRISGAWFDIARVDSLFLFFLLLAVYVVRFYSSAPSLVLAGALISLSFFTKQTALLSAILLMIYLLAFKRNNVFYFIGTVFVLIGGGILFFNNIHQGYFNYYIFYLPTHHGLIREMLVDFWTKDILLPSFIACGFAVFYFVWRATVLDRDIVCMYMALFAGMILGSWVSRLHEGGYDNVLFPAYAIISILFGLGAHSLIEAVNVSFVNRRGVILRIVYSVCVLQFCFLFYNPVKQIPTSKDLKAGKKLLGMISHIKGDVFIPFHGYLGVLAGKKSNTHEMALEDILRTNNESDPNKERLIAQIKEAIRTQRFSAIILDTRDWHGIEKYCPREEKIFEDDGVFWTVTGFRTRPDWIFLSKDQP